MGLIKYKTYVGGVEALNPTPTWVTLAPTHLILIPPTHLLLAADFS